MNITATIKNDYQNNIVSVATDSNEKEITILAKPTGRGSLVNGGELLFLSVATCFCNDVYREAAKRNMTIDAVEVTVTGEFGKEGKPATNIAYRVNIIAPDCSAQQITDLINYVDDIAEVHKTLRNGVQVTLQGNNH